MRESAQTFPSLSQVGWLFWFYVISTFVDYLMPIHFYTNNQLYLKQLSLA